MLRRYPLALVALLLVVSASAQPDDQQEKKALDGTWNVVKLSKGTVTAAKELIDPLTFVIAGDRMKMMVKDMVVAEVELKIDPSKQPRQIDVTDLTGPQKGMVSLGIYELDGNKLKTCFFVDATDPKKRPDSFTGAAKAPVAVVEFERTKK
jgi:uncharacterized protein (TIGR03067 family)